MAGHNTNEMLILYLCVRSCAPSCKCIYGHGCECASLYAAVSVQEIQRRSVEEAEREAQLASEAATVSLTWRQEPLLFYILHHLSKVV